MELWACHDGYMPQASTPTQYMQHSTLTPQAPMPGSTTVRGSLICFPQTCMSGPGLSHPTVLYPHYGHFSLKDLCTLAITMPDQSSTLKYLGPSPGPGLVAPVGVPQLGVQSEPRPPHTQTQIHRQSDSWSIGSNPVSLSWPP